MADVQKVLATMLEKDHFSKWLGIIVDEYKDGYCRLHFRVREEMLNGFGIVHGGVVFSAADSAFAFACNAQGRVSVALDVTISFIRPAKAGDELFIEAKELHSGYKTGIYDITIKNVQEELVAIFKGTAYRTSRLVYE